MINKAYIHVMRLKSKERILRMDYKQEEQAEFLEAIENYQYFDEHGRLMLEPFGVYLSHCFGFDGILEKSPQPLDVYLLLINTLSELLGEKEAQKYVAIKQITDWTPDLIYIFPEKTMTLIQIGGLVSTSDTWIYSIGHRLMGIPEPKTPSKYFSWAKEEWVAVHAFINGYHNALFSLMKKMDAKQAQKNGYSLFEALHLAKHKKIDFNSAVEIIKARHNSYQSALRRIQKAIQDGYFLEAITLEECLISNCIYNYLANTDAIKNNSSFSELLKKARENTRAVDSLTAETIEQIDSWRRSRNTAIHGFISATSESLDQSHSAFTQLAKTTADEGKLLCEKVTCWYEAECVDFIPHEFPSQTVIH